MINELKYYSHENKTRNNQRMCSHSGRFVMNNICKKCKCEYKQLYYKAGLTTSFFYVQFVRFVFANVLF